MTVVPTGREAAAGRLVGAVIIVNYNSGACLARCLSSVAEHAPDAHVVVVDNRSGDGSEERALEWPDRVSLVRNDQNIGFARAVNQALRGASGDWVMFLNPDCELQPGALGPLVAEIETHPECAVAAPRILNEDGRTQGSVRGDPTWLTGLFGRTSLLTQLFPRSAFAQRNVRTEQLAEGVSSHVVDWVSGACMLARRTAIDAVGGFDEGYFLYWEDADLCLRLRHAGFTIRYVPAAQVTHTVGQSSRTARPLAIRAFHESAYRYYATHVARGRALKSLAWLVLWVRCRVKLLANRIPAHQFPRP